MSLSPRGEANAAQLSIPWHFAKPHTYNPITNPEGLISFATAENHLIQKDLHTFVAKVSVPATSLRYEGSTGGGPRLPSAFAAHINEYFSAYWTVEGDDVKVTAAATGLHDVLAFNLCAEDEGILISRPYYGRFEIDFGNKARVQLVAVDTDHEHCFDEGVAEAFEKKLREREAQGMKIRAVLVVNPHNPLGQFVKAGYIVRGADKAHRLHFISDEVYALSVFDNPDAPDANAFVSALSIDPEGVIDQDLIHVIYGLSKDFGLAGLKIGCLITRNEELKLAVTAVQRFTAVSGLSVAVATAMLEDRVWVRKLISLSRARLAEGYKFVTSRLKETGIEVMGGGNAGFFVWLNLSPWLPPEGTGRDGRQREQMLAQEFVNNGVFLQPGEEHGRIGWYRIVFTMERTAVEEGLRRVYKTLNEVSW